jgi:hypothetical protein
MAGTSDDNSTIDQWWFFNPELARLAADERRFFAEWTRSEKAAEELLVDCLARRSIAWYAELEFELCDLGLRMPTGSPIELPISYAAVWLGFWVDPSRLSIDWEASSAIYTGPTMLLHKNSDGYVFFDSRTPIRIAARLIRFRHEDSVRRLRALGLMPWPAAIEPADVEPKERSRHQFDRTIAALRKRYSPEGKTPVSKSFKILTAEVAEDPEIKKAVEQGKAAPSEDVVTAAVKQLGRSAD